MAYDTPTRWGQQRWGSQPPYLRIHAPVRRLRHRTLMVPDQHQAKCLVTQNAFAGQLIRTSCELGKTKDRWPYRADRHLVAGEHPGTRQILVVITTRIPAWQQEPAGRGAIRSQGDLH